MINLNTANHHAVRRTANNFYPTDCEAAIKFKKKFVRIIN